MTAVRIEIEIDERLLELVDERAAATGRRRDEVIQQALRDQLEGRDDLVHLLDRVRERSDLSEEEAMALARAELKAMRAERRRGASP